ncbi:MAG: hypothetical protein MJ215_05260 [Spirochaetia bacterium]|nr:hypothetical protein [Spirochaetia bacterium]
MEDITKEELENIIKKALDTLYEKDKYLIVMPGENAHVGERSIVFRLAHYMATIIENDNELREYKLDCEFNRNIIYAKELPLFSNCIYPDIIIHQRGNNDHNLLVIEVKTYWNNNTEQDIKKLNELVSKNGKYHYLHSVSLVLNETREAVCIKWLPKE